jgi:hypothetical protein
MIHSGCVQSVRGRLHKYEASARPRLGTWAYRNHMAYESSPPAEAGGPSAMDYRCSHRTFAD